MWSLKGSMWTMNDVSPKPRPGLLLSQTPLISHAQFVEQFKLKSIIFFPPLVVNGASHRHRSLPYIPYPSVFGWTAFFFCAVFAKGLDIIIVVKQPSEQ